jgi:hypothetical protein
MTDIATLPRFITVAGPSDDTTKEWHLSGRLDYDPPPVHKDYALLKVLSMLRMKSKTERYAVHPFKWEKKPTPIDFSTLEENDVIFVVGHGDDHRLYATGPNRKRNVERFVDHLLIADGNLKKKRAEKDIILVLLSCRSGFGLYKTVAERLFKKLGRDLTVGGAIGFTFGSPRTKLFARNEVLIKGIPWRIEYPLYISEKEAEKETSKREGRQIKIADKEKEIKAFKKEKGDIEDALKKIMDKLKSTEVNKALDEIEKDFESDWNALIVEQFKLYGVARKRSNLEFDMWFDLITDGYVWTTGKKVTAADVASLLGGTDPVINDVGTTIK